MFAKTRIIIYSVLLISVEMFAQDCGLSIRGTVRDEDNNEQLSFAVVKLLSPALSFQTNEKGEFVINGLCAGEYQLLVQHIGCRDTVFTIALSRSKKVILKLPHSLNALQDIEILAEHAEVRSTQVTESLEGKELDKSRGQNLAEQLKQLSGVSVLNTGPTVSKPMVNGMQGYRLLLLNNGIRHEGQQWGSEHAPEIDPFIGQKLTVIRGASAVRYGSDAIGGVVLIEPAPLHDTTGLSGEVNTIGFSNGRGGALSGQLQGNVGKIKYLNWRVQGTLKRSGNIRTPEYYLSNTGSSEYNYSYALAYHRKNAGIALYYSQFNSRIGIFSGAHTGNLTDLYAAFNRSRPIDSLAGFSYNIAGPYQQIAHELIKLSSDFHTGPRSRFYAIYAWQYNHRREYDQHGSTAINTQEKPASDYRLTTQTGELIWEHDYIRSFRGRFGVQGMHQGNIYREKFFIPNYRNRTIGFFAIERFVRSHYELEAGLRYDYKKLESFFYRSGVLQRPELNFSNLSYQLGGVYKPTELFKLNLNLASGWRSPSVNELYSDGLHHGVGAIERGDAALKSETCLNASGMAVFEHKGFYAAFSAYAYRFDNFIYYLPAPLPELTIRGAFPVFNYRQDDANINGADLQLSQKIGKYITIKGKAMWVRGTNKNTGEPLIYMPSDRYEARLVLNSKNTTKFTGNYFELVYQFVDRQKRVPSQADFVAPPGAYHLFGFNVGTQLQVKKQILHLTFSVSNAANEVYRDYLDRFRYYNDASGTNYTLRLRMPFDLSRKNNNNSKPQ